MRFPVPFPSYPHVIAETGLACSHQSAAVWLLPSPLPAQGHSGSSWACHSDLSRRALRPEPGGHVPALPPGQARGGGRVVEPDAELGAAAEVRARPALGLLGFPYKVISVSQCRVLSNQRAKWFLTTFFFFFFF